MVHNRSYYRLEAGEATLQAASARHGKDANYQVRGRSFKTRSPADTLTTLLRHSLFAVANFYSAGSD